MSLGDYLGRLVRQLDQASIPYMVSGSVASSVHGEPRSTQDLDIVIDPTGNALKAFLSMLPDDQYYVSEDADLDALKRRSQFNVIDFETGWKAELIVRKDRPFSLVEFSRRQRARILGVDVSIVTPEDVILAKLEWSEKGGGSERQLRDVRGILDAPGHQLDLDYISEWANKLGISAVWETARTDS